MYERVRMRALCMCKSVLWQMYMRMCIQKCTCMYVGARTCKTVLLYEKCVGV